MPLAQPADWTSIGPKGHAVQFYPTEGHLLDLLARFIGTALVTGDVGIVIATREHRDGLARRLKSRGFEVAVARRQGRYLALDAEETLVMREHPIVGDAICTGLRSLQKELCKAIALRASQTIF